MLTRIVVALPAMLILAPALRAQEQSPDTARVTPVVVTATRTPLERGALPVAVTIIQGDELRARGIMTVADALRSVTSAYIAQAGSQGATTSLFLRGGESKYVKVLVDGVPVNDPGGAFDFASLTTDNVERIEVVRGPASVVHGADAVTGVVHVLTRRGQGAPQGEVRLSLGGAARSGTAGGSPDPMRLGDASVTVHGTAPVATAYSVALARHQSTGLYESNNQYQNNVFSGRVDFAAREGTDMRLHLRYTDYQFNYPTDGGGSVVDANAHRADDRMVLGVEVEQRATEATRVVLALSSSVNEGGTDDRADSPTDASFISQDRIRRRGADLRVHGTSSLAVITIGAQLEQQDQRSQSQSSSTFGDFVSNFRAVRRNVAGYAEAVFGATSPLTATVGARLDHSGQFGDFGTGRAGVSWRPRAGTRVRATVGNAFREPTFFETYATGFVTGNPDLEPERTTTWDGGVDQDLWGGRATLSVTGFAQRFVNMIDYEPSATACGYSYCNVAEATANGVEVEASGRIHGPFALAVGGTLLETKVVEPGYDASSGGLYRRGESLIRRPERNVSADLSYRGGGPLTASVRVLAVGVRSDRDFRSFPSVPVVLPSYERLDLSAEYALPTRTRSALSLRVENVTDERYENVFNFLTPRRTISVGLRSTF